MALARSRGRQEKTIPSKHRCSHSSRKEKESAVSYTESIRCFKQSIRQADEGDSMAASYLRRNEHQPKQGPVERPVPEGAELARACGKTIALVLATDFGTTPLKVSFEDENEKPAICEDPKNGERKTPRPLRRLRDDGRRHTIGRTLRHATCRIDGHGGNWARELRRAHHL